MGWVIPWVTGKIRRAKISPPIINVKCFDGDGEIVLNKVLEVDKGGMNIRVAT